MQAVQIMADLFAIWCRQACIMPGVHVGIGNSGPGCFTDTHIPVISHGQLFGWEMVMTFTLVSVVYATAIAKPGHGSMAPLAIGFTLFASAFVGARVQSRRRSMAVGT
jgi:glycerol uptake facilitator-like aquaporin